MLRNRPTASSDKTVWLDSRACVDEGETVVVEERVRAFARVRTASGETGWIKSQYLVKPAASPKSAYKCRVCGLPKKGHTCPGVWHGVNSTLTPTRRRSRAAAAFDSTCANKGNFGILIIVIIVFIFIIFVVALL